MYASLFITLFVRYGGDFGKQINFHILPFTIIFTIWLIIFYIVNLYDISFAKNSIAFLSTLLYSILSIAVIATIFFYVVPFFGITPKTNLLIFMTIATFLEVIWRFNFNLLLIKSGHINNALIVGNNHQSQELYEFLLANPQLGYNALGIIDIKRLTDQNILENLIRQKKITNLVLSPEAYHVPHIVDVFYRLLGFKINFYNLSDFYEKVTGRVPIGAIDRVWFLEKLSERTKSSYETVKRIADIALSVVFGIVVVALSPFIAAGIKFTSPGPIFYKQKRTGRDGKVFELIKFRTMVQEAESISGPVWAAEKDNRTTRVGRFLRRSRIDELPQMWNVLKGDLSFVGPRPERPEFYDKLHREIPFYEARYLVKPGLTGWAQIKHKLDFRGGMTVADTYEKFQHDLYYIKNRSLMLDLGISLKTIYILLKKALR